MITKNISGVVFECPESINDYTIKKWQEMYDIESKVEEYGEEKADEYLLEWFRTLTELSMSTITNKMNWDDTKAFIIEMYPKVTTTPLEAMGSNVIEIDGIEYQLPPMNKLTVGDVLYIKEVQRQNNNNVAITAPNIIATLFRETVNNQRVELDEGLEERIELFKNRVMIKDVIKPLNFFLRGLTS